MKSILALITEKVVLGLIETIELEGIGAVKAKVDSGNELYNVLDGQNISFKQNGTVTFNTFGKNIEKRVKDRVTINVGAGNSEERPVVQFNVRLKGKVYKDIPFSIGNRGNNDEKVLLGVNFLEIINCLIDPTED